MAYIGRDVTYGTYEVQNLTPDSTNDTFTLDYGAASAGSLLVVYAGIVQQPNVNYTLGSDGTQIVFAAPPTTGATLYIVYLGRQLTTARTANSDVVTDTFTGNGNDTNFALSALPPNNNCVLVFVDGVQQRATTNYSVSGTALIFTSAPDNGAEIDTIIIGTERSSISNIADGSVSTAKIQNYAVTEEKLDADLALQLTNLDLGTLSGDLDLFSIDCGTLV